MSIITVAEDDHTQAQIKEPTRVPRIGADTVGAPSTHNLETLAHGLIGYQTRDPATLTPQETMELTRVAAQLESVRAWIQHKFNI